MNNLFNFHSSGKTSFYLGGRFEVLCLQNGNICDGKEIRAMPRNWGEV